MNKIKKLEVKKKMKGMLIKEELSTFLMTVTIICIKQFKENYHKILYIV